MNKKLLELGKQICTKIGSHDIECVDTMVIDNIEYAFAEVESMTWESEGKYDIGQSIWQIGFADEECSWNIKEGRKLDLYIMQCASRTGSYYSDYYYEYDEPFVVESKEIVTREWIQIKED